MSSNDRRINALRTLRLAAESLRNLGVMAVQREIHNIFADKFINASELSNLQSEWNGVADHLDSLVEDLNILFDKAVDDAFSDSLSMSYDGIRNGIDPEPHGVRTPIDPRDLTLECPACGNCLPLNADCRCAGCGNG